MGKAFDMAQAKEFQFWQRWSKQVREDFETPLDYVRHRIADTLEQRGLCMEDFQGKSVIEYGPGMYPMVSALPVKFKRVVEPLYYQFQPMFTPDELKLWKGLVIYRGRGENYQYEKHFDYCLLKNVLDHTTAPAELIANISADTVLVDSFVGRHEDTELHPSAFGTVDEIKDLFVNYKCTFESSDDRLMLYYLTFQKGTK